LNGTFFAVVVWQEARQNFEVLPLNLPPSSGFGICQGAGVSNNLGCGPSQVFLRQFIPGISETLARLLVASRDNVGHCQQVCSRHILTGRLCRWLGWGHGRNTVWMMIAAKSTNPGDSHISAATIKPIANQSQRPVNFIFSPQLLC
jgi:hypothetical protein